MSQVIEANCPILSNPPWKGGKAKYRLGLKPINLNEWFDAKISSEDIELYRKIYSEEYKKRKYSSKATRFT